MSRRKQTEPCCAGESGAKRKKGEAGEVVSLTSQRDVEWEDDEKARLMQAMERDGGKDDWDAIAKAVQTRTVDQVKQYVEWMIGKSGDDKPVRTSSTEESLLQNWIQTTADLRSERDNIDGTCIPQLSSHQTEDTASCIEKTSFSSQALHQGNRRKNLWSISRSANSCPRHSCSCSVVQLHNGSVHEGNGIHDASNSGDCAAASFVNNEDNAVSLDKLYSSQMQLMELVSAQAEAIDKLTSDVSTANAFNSQLMQKLEQISSRLDNISSEMKTNATGAPIVIQAPPRTTIIHQPMTEASAKENVPRPVENPPVVIPKPREATETNQNTWPRIKAVASQVPFHAICTQASTTVHVSKTTSAGTSQDVFFPRVSLVSRPLVSGAINCSPLSGKKEVVTLGALAKVPIARKYVPAVSTSGLTSQESGDLGQAAMPAHGNGSAKTPHTIHYSTASSLAQCNPSSTSNLCCHGSNSRNCQTCLTNTVGAFLAKTLVPRKEASCASTSTTNTTPPYQRNCADSASMVVNHVERPAQPTASCHVTSEAQRSDVTSERQEETARPSDGDLGSVAERSVVPGMMRIGGKADVLLPKGLFEKFLHAAAGRPNILALRLAEGLFGHDVLMASTPNGIGDKAALNPHILEAIKDEILCRFAPGGSPLEKKDLWRQCHTAIAQLCKRARSMSLKKSNPRRSFDHAIDPTHSEGKLDNRVESEYTGSEASLSDREEARGLQEIHAESQEWFPPTEGDSDITVVHIPSEFQCSEVRTDIPAEGDPTPDQSNLPNTDSHSGSDASGCSEDGVPIGGDDQLTIPKVRYLEALKKTGQATVFAVRLAELLFGDDVLEVSTVTGSRGTERLDERILNAIQAEVSKRFLSNKNYDVRCSVWKKCLNSIATKCKLLRYTKPQKPDENAALLDAEPS